MLSLKSVILLSFCVGILAEEQQRLLIDQLRWEFMEIEDELWDFASNGLLYKNQDESELFIVKRFHDFDQKLRQMPDDFLRGMEPLRTIPDFLYFYSELKAIGNKYEKFREYLLANLKNSTDKVMMEDMIYDILNNKTGMNKSANYLYDLAFGSEDNIMIEIYKIIDDNFWCKNLEQSPQQLFYNLYNTESLYELKAYVMQQFAYLGNRLWEKGNNIELSITTRKNYEKRTTGIIKSLRYAIQHSRDIWRCDPKNYVKGKTYEEFTRLVQGHIQNEVDMSATRTCTKTCSEYTATKSYGCYDYESDFCRKVERCDGRIYDCHFIDSDASICLSGSPSRRYDYIKYDSGKSLGHFHGCSNQKTVDSWTRWFVRCHYCMCLCDAEGPKSDRFINLRPVLADIKNNRVVTGLRLVKHNRILHLQIQEGKLLPYGFVNDSTVHWVPVDNYKITDNKIKNGEDYFTMSYMQRAMALDEIQVNQDSHIVTGVRFELLKNQVHFEIHVSPFDWYTGKIQQNGGYYIYETNPSGRSVINLYNADVPILTTSPSDIHYSGTKSYVQFTHTSYDKDAGQTTIPYLDLQEVVNTPAVPLMGAGIYYKGTRGYGGFIAPRIKTYDFGKHISSLVPRMSDRVEISHDVEVN